MNARAQQDQALAKALAREEAEAARRAEGKDEAARRHRVKKYLSDWQRLHDLLEPETPELEMDELDAASRIEEGDRIETAVEREVFRALDVFPSVGSIKADLSARSIALRITGAYDEEYAYAVESLPSHAISAERVYAHLLSFESIDRSLAPQAVRSIARRTTVLLLNRRYLAPGAKRREPEPEPAEEAAPAEEPELCLDCGRDIHAAGPGCESCEKTVSDEAPKEKVI